MDVNRKLNLMMFLVGLNLCVSGLTGASQIQHLRWATDNFRIAGDFQASVLQYRQAAEKLQEERWTNLMNRLEVIEANSKKR